MTTRLSDFRTLWIHHHHYGESTIHDDEADELLLQIYKDLCQHAARCRAVVAPRPVAREWLEQFLDTTIHNCEANSRHLTTSATGLEIDDPDGWVSARSEDDIRRCDHCDDRCLQRDMLYAERHPSYGWLCEACHDQHEPPEEPEDEDEHPGLMANTADPLATHSGFLRADKEPPSALPTLWLGVELEVMPRRGVDRSRIVDEVRDSVDDFAILKHDGSVSEHGGFEIATVPATLAAHRELWDTFFTHDASQLRGWTAPGDFGLHVHVDRRALGDLAAGKLMCFLHSEDNRPFVTHIAGRNGNSYVQFWGDTTPTQIRKMGRGHYDAAGPSVQYRTIEIRIFRSNVSRPGFFRALEFAHAICRFCQWTSAAALRAEDFCAWFGQPENRKDHPDLAAWMQANGYITLRKTPPVLAEER